MAGGLEAALLADITPARLRALTLDALVAVVVRAAALRPVALVVEDVHWLDPDDPRARRAAGGGGFRPAAPRPAVRAGGVSPAARTCLGRDPDPRPQGLAPAEATELFEALSDTATPGLGRDLAARTSGVPMFLEEFASALNAARIDGELSAVSTEPAIPATLTNASPRASTGPVRPRAWPRSAPCSARHASERPASPRSPAAPLELIERALARLETAGVLIPTVRVDGKGWSFRHALLREAAYASLLRDRRRALHGRAADALADRWSPRSSRTTSARRTASPRACRTFCSAAREASPVRRCRRHAAASARTRGGRGARRGQEQSEQRLELMSLLGPALIGLYGPASIDTQALYAEAVALARSLPPRAGSFPIFWGWWRLSHVDDFHESRRRADWLFEEAQSRNEPALLLQAHHCNWASLFHHGDFRGCDRHAADGLNLYRRTSMASMRRSTAITTPRSAGTRTGRSALAAGLRARGRSRRRARCRGRAISAMPGHCCTPSSSPPRIAPIGATPTRCGRRPSAWQASPRNTGSASTAPAAGSFAAGRWR